MGRKIFVLPIGQLGNHFDSRYLLNRPFTIPDPKEPTNRLRCECGALRFVFGSSVGDAYCMSCKGLAVAYGQEQDRKKLDLA
jgi:hypothetical protein